MKIEKLSLQLVPTQIQQVQMNYKLSTPKKTLILSPEDFQLYSLLTQSLSIHDVVDHYLKNGWIIRFQSLYGLIFKLHQSGWIQNPVVSAEINNWEEENPPPSLFDTLKEQLWKPTSRSSRIELGNELKDLPFFRNLDTKIIDFFSQSSKTIDISEGVQICSAGDRSRDLFVLLEGEVGIFRADSSGKNRRVAKLTSGSVFGEGAYFLGHPRSASILSITECRLLKIKYRHGGLETILGSDRGQLLQQRIWILNGLLNSPIFQKIPSETFDALVFLGQAFRVPANQAVCREGDRGDSFYILIQGSLQVSQQGRVIRKMPPGTPFGEIALLASQGKRTATVTATQDSLVLQIKANDFYRFLGENIFLAVQLENLAWTRWNEDQKRKAS